MLITKILARVSCLLFVFVAANTALGQSICEPSYPVPDDEGLVFYLQHTANPTTIVYAANQRADGSIDPSGPVDVFRRYLGGSGRKADLGFWERQVAFGVRTTPLAGQPGKYVASLNAAPHIQVRLEPNEAGGAQVVMPIAGEEAQLVCIYVEWQAQLGFIPNVLYVDFHGYTLDGRRQVVERRTP